MMSAGDMRIGTWVEHVATSVRLYVWAMMMQKIGNWWEFGLT